ncbi:MAG TPA: CpsD/CapB family tyrosine-protein kinase [Caulobacteraceae bacterium]
MSETLPMQRASPAPARSLALRETDLTYEFSPSLVMLSRTTDGTAESMRALRTHIVAQHVDHGRRALAVCGPNPGVGCTFVAANLAVSLSQIGLKTLLIDANLREPAIGALIKPSREVKGLAQCLASSDDVWLDCISPEVVADLSVMYAGETIPDAQTLLAKYRFETLIDFCLRNFDVTILDTPPANSCADARLISNVVRYSLVVARKDRTFVDDVKLFVGQLESDNVKVIGTVFNQA